LLLGKLAKVDLTLFLTRRHRPSYREKQSAGHATFEVRLMHPMLIKYPAHNGWKCRSPRIPTPMQGHDLTGWRQARSQWFLFICHR
jgi:hypothetical protein